MEKKGGKGTKSRWDKQNTNSKMRDLTPTLSIITLNVHDLNRLIKRHRLSDWLKKRELYASYKKHTLHRETEID